MSIFHRIIRVLKKIRNLYLIKIKWHSYHIGSNFHCGRRVNLWARNKIHIGKNCYIGRNSSIECDSVIGNNVLIANNVALVGKYDHNYSQVGLPIRLSSQIRDKDYNWLGLQSIVEIEDDVWIGYGAIILSGVKIRRGSIIAAGSVVTKDVEPYTIVGGNPASYIRHRFTKEEISKHEESCFDNSKFYSH